MCSTRGVAKEPIFTANDKRFYRALCSVVIDAQVPVLCVTHQFFPLAECIGDGLAESRFWWDLLAGFIQPGFKFREQRYEKYEATHLLFQRFLRHIKNRRWACHQKIHGPSQLRGNSASQPSHLQQNHKKTFKNPSPHIHWPSVSSKALRNL
jgi:hypothetical protein